MLSLSRLSVLLMPACLWLALANLGCRSFSGPGSASFASVTIEKQSEEEIVAATVRVFTADGWRGGVSGPGKMVFEQEASRATSYSREGVSGAYYGAQTIKRVRAELVQLAPERSRLQCQAYMVSGGKDPFFQDEVPMTSLRSAPYQILLNKVKSELKKNPGS